MLGLFVLALTLTIGPYTGPSLPGTVPGTAKFAVGVRGKPGATVNLRAVGIPKGYIASFCTRLVCSPFRVSLALPASGRDRIELQLIENQTGVRRPRVVTVAADGARPVAIAFARATR